MEIAKISSKGQITVPIAVRKALHLKEGDKLVILEDNGRYYIENAALLAFNRAETDFSGEAGKAGFENEAEMQDYMKDIRREVRSY